MVLRLEVELGLGADGAERDEVVLATLGHVRQHDVRDRPDDLVERVLGLGDRGLRLLHLRGERLGLLHERGLLVLRGLRDRLAEGVLLGAEGLERGDRAPPRRVRGDGVVDDVDGRAARLLRGLDDVRVVTQQLGVDHRTILRGPHQEPAWRPVAGPHRASRPVHGRPGIPSQHPVGSVAACRPLRRPRLRTPSRPSSRRPPSSTTRSRCTCRPSSRRSSSCSGTLAGPRPCGSRPRRRTRAAA